MEPLRLNSQDALRPAWGGVGEEAALPVRANAWAEHGVDGRVHHHTDSAAHAGAGNATDRPWWRTVLRVARDAAIGLALITAVPVAVVAVRGVPLPPIGQELLQRMETAQPLRAHTLPVNADVTPAQAGAALHRLHTQLRAASGAFFPELSEPAASRAQSPALAPLTLEQRRAVAEHPIWREVDFVASAEAVDVLVGAYPKGFPAGMSTRELGIPPFARLKELTEASQVRADYYRLIGEPDRAVAAAQAAISLGFSYIDDGNSTISALIGRVMLGRASEGLRAQYQQLGDAREFSVVLPVRASSAPGSPTDFDERAYTQRILAQAGDPALPRSVRWEQVRLQSLMSCGSVLSMLRPNAAALDGMYAQAGRELVRYPSEQAYLELIRRTATTLPSGFPAANSLGDRLVMGAATVAGTVLQNPRIPACTRLAVE